MVSQRKRLNDETGSNELGAHRILETLADGRCRSVLSHLVWQGGRAELDELARSARDDEGAAVRLHHVVLPKLDDVGLLEYDPEAHTVELLDPVSWVHAFLFGSAADY